jgi:hypothetical protein
LQQQITQIPPLVSSVEVDLECDDHATEAWVCLKIINSPRGRELKNGEPDEQKAFQNLRLHYLEHAAALKAKQGQQKPTGKPPSLSANVKDLPPKESAAVLQLAGIPATAQDFQAQDVADAAEKHPGPGGIVQ